MAKLQELSKGITFEDCADEILNDLKNCNLCIGHNISFDLKFIKKEFERLGIYINYEQEKIYCTMHEYTDILKLKRYGHSEYKWPKLSEVVTFLNMDEQKLLDLTKEKYNICDDEFNGYHDSRFDVVCTYMIYLSKETEDDESKQLVYYMEKSKIESHPPLNKSKKRKESSIFKDLFSFKGEIDNKKFSILIWSIIILRSICMSIIRYCGRNSVEFINEIGLFILAISLILLQFSMIAVIIKRLRTKKESLQKIIRMMKKKLLIKLKIIKYLL